MINNINNIIKQEIKKGEEKIKIFENNFVKNNKNNCKIICNKKEYELMEYYDMTKYQNEKNILEIELLFLILQSLY